MYRGLHRIQFRTGCEQHRIQIAAGVSKDTSYFTMTDGSGEVTLTRSSPAQLYLNIFLGQFKSLLISSFPAAEKNSLQEEHHR